MSEIAAKAPARPRRRLIVARLVPYLLLQALIVIVTILGLRLLQPSDPTILQSADFRCGRTAPPVP
ncbi:hypothetical protein ACQ5SK_15900 [Bradyrhizobium japonicum]